jgi:multiple sugar transport system permease protein
MSDALPLGLPATARRPRFRRGTLTTIIGRSALALFLAVWMLPLYWLVNTTFKYKVQIQSEMPVWFPSPPTMENIDWVLNNLDHAAIYRSIRVVAVSVLFSVIFGPLMAYALSRFRTRFNRQLESWIISTRMMPPAALIMPFYFIFLRVHLLNNELGLMLLYIAINLPLTSWIMLAYLRGLPEDAEEAARIDGCTRWGAFWHIILPMTRASIAAAGLLVTILTWNEFFIAFVITSSNITFPVQVAGFLANGMNPEYGHMAAAGLLLSLPTVLIAIIFHRALLSGLHAFAGGK